MSEDQQISETLQRIKENKDTLCRIRFPNAISRNLTFKSEMTTIVHNFVHANYDDGILQIEDILVANLKIPLNSDKNTLKSLLNMAAERIEQRYNAVIKLIEEDNKERPRVAQSIINDLEKVSPHMGNVNGTSGDIVKMWFVKTDFNAQDLLDAFREKRNSVSVADKTPYAKALNPGPYNR